jgi:hypothetical protein
MDLFREISANKSSEYSGGEMAGGPEEWIAGLK